MATSVTSSVVQAWELGLRLREHREQLGLTANDVGKTTRIGGSNLSAIENGKRRLTAVKLTALAGVYELPAEELAELETIRARAERREWYHDYSTLHSDEFLRFLGLEAGAASERNYQAELIPGLLQTADYARALTKGGSPYIRPVDVGPLVESRLARQARLSGATPLRLSVVINQAALLQEVGGRAVQARQLEHLAEVIDDQHDHVEIRIMPFTAGAHPLIGSQTVILSFDSPRLPDLLWQETVSSQTILDRRDKLRECAASFDAATDQALSREDSLALIQHTRKEIA
ncbi:MAG: Scr1 family TA system antitoxin-like transcriptional regulator [Pseudonocardiaceae bacterium]